MSDNFIHALMDNILDGLMVPKFQVERAISPILGIFLEDILTNIFNSEDSENIDKRFKMVCAEFPLRKNGDEGIKGNNQSTNIDWLLYDTKLQHLIFFELKTSDTSFEKKQFKRYIEISEMTDFSSLITDLKKIKKASKERGKYTKLIDDVEKIESKITKCKKARVIYLVPKSATKKLTDRIANNDAFTVLSFSDLPKSISGEFSDKWEIIHEKLERIDNCSQENRNGPPEDNSRNNFEGKIDFSEVMKKCKDEGDLIQVGFTGGIDVLMRQSISALKKRKFIWDNQIEGKGNKIDRNWIKGNTFLEIVSRLHEEA